MKTLIDRFNEFDDYCNGTLSATEQLLYIHLLLVWNRTGRREMFFATNQQLMLKSGISCRNTLSRARNALKQKGIIDFRSGAKKGQATEYTFLGDNLGVNNAPLNAPLNAPPIREREREREERETRARKARVKFIPPTLDEVLAYCREKSLNVDGERFLEYFSASNWVDAKGNAVKNWKQKLLTWHNYGKGQAVHTVLPTVDYSAANGFI